MLSIDPENLLWLDDIDEPLQCYLGVIISQSICETVEVSASEMFIPNFLKIECKQNLRVVFTFLFTFVESL